MLPKIFFFLLNNSFEISFCQRTKKINQSPPCVNFNINCYKYNLQDIVIVSYSTFKPVFYICTVEGRGLYGNSISTPRRGVEIRFSYIILCKSGIRWVLFGLCFAQHMAVLLNRTFASSIDDNNTSVGLLLICNG